MEKEIKELVKTFKLTKVDITSVAENLVRDYIERDDVIELHFQMSVISNLVSTIKDHPDFRDETQTFALENAIDKGVTQYTYKGHKVGYVYPRETIEYEKASPEYVKTKARIKSLGKLILAKNTRLEEVVLYRTEIKDLERSLKAQEKKMKMEYKLYQIRTPQVPVEFGGNPNNLSLDIVDEETGEILFSPRMMPTKTSKSGISVTLRAKPPTQKSP